MRRIAIAAGLMACAGMAAAAGTAKAPRAPAKEQLTCRTGPNDKQARLTVQMVKGRPMEFAYYSRLGTQVCSIHGRRGDAYTKWEDASDTSTVKLIEGIAMLEYKPGYLKLRFGDVGRMIYCGMEGELNGVVEVTKKSSECGLQGVFE